MRVRFSTITRCIRILLLSFATSASGIAAVNASNGYISLGYGPISPQSGQPVIIPIAGYVGSPKPSAQFCPERPTTLHPADFRVAGHAKP